MKIIIGGEDDQGIKRTGDEFFKKSESPRARDEGFEAYFKQDEIKVVGLKKQHDVYPNGAKMSFLEEKKHYTLFVETQAGNKRKYEVDKVTRKVSMNGKVCNEEETEQFYKIMRYMKNNSNETNSSTIVFKFKKEGVI